MNGVLMKRIPLVLASLVCSANVFAGTKDKGDDQGCNRKDADGCYAIELASGRMGCFLQPDRPAVDLCHGFELSASALYWRPYVEGTEYAWTNTGASTALPINGNLVGVKGKFNWGFQVGIGYLFSNDAWRADLDFTFHQGKGSSSLSDEWNQVIVPSTAYTSSILNGSTVTSFTNAESNFNSDFYRLDLSLTRGTFVSKFLVLTPGFALTTTWLDISQKSRFSDVDHNTLTEKKASKTWQIGPTGSLDTRLAFGNSGFSLTGEWDMTLGFGKTRIDQNSYYSTNPTTNAADLSHNPLTFSPSAHALLGLQYDRDYFDHTQHLTVMAGLDTFVMWSGNRVIRTINTVPVQFEQNSDNTFALIGLTVAFNYQF
jgi:hypothetical protein